MNNKYNANQIQCECGGYLKPGNVREHLQTTMHKDGMKYLNGFKFDTKCGRKHIVVYKDYLTTEEKDELLDNHHGYDEVWTYQWFVREGPMPIT